MQKILDRVKRLLAIANHPNSNPHEAESAAKRAQSLITKHGIEQAQLRAEQKKDEPIVQLRMLRSNRVAKHKLWLVGGIAAANNCEYYYSPGYSVTVYGHKSNVDLVKDLYEVLINSVEYWAKREAKGKGRRFVNGYKIGMSLRIGERLKEAKKQAEKDATDPTKIAEQALANGESVNEALSSFSLEKVTKGLVLYKNQRNLVQTWGKLNLKLRSAPSNSRADSAGLASGRRRGNSVGLGGNRSLK